MGMYNFIWYQLAVHQGVISNVRELHLMQNGVEIQVKLDGLFRRGIRDDMIPIKEIHWPDELTFM